MFKNLFLGLILLNTVQAMDCPRADLKGFHKDPKGFLEAPLPKFDKNCQAVSFTLFNKSSIADGSFVEKKDSARKSFCHTDPVGAQKICLKNIAPGDNVLAGRAPIKDLDRVENLVPEDIVIRELSKIEDAGLQSGEVAMQPWSDWYWPIAVGQLSYRYNDPVMLEELQRGGFDEKNAWTKVNAWHSAKPAMPVDVNALSPAEKYDLLMGDTNYTLTKKMLQAGAYYQNNFGMVESWMGLCHGWAPASYMLPRPRRSLTLSSPGAGLITFLPSDLKALGTLLWSNGLQQNKFMGGRCNASNPSIDPASGKVLDEECFDNNPGSWHMAVVSHIGKLKSPFVMDATFDYEVWNHPVTAYAYAYFNPIEMEYKSSIEEARVSIEDFANDKFKAFRSKEAKSVIGIVMEVKYLVETVPSLLESDSEEKDAFNVVQYIYDLELDENGQIVGGEWYTNKHPDFLWTPHVNSRAKSIVDDYLPQEFSLSFIGNQALNELAPYASEQGQPIGALIEAMLNEAQ